MASLNNNYIIARNGVQEEVDNIYSHYFGNGEWMYCHNDGNIVKAIVQLIHSKTKYSYNGRGYDIKVIGPKLSYSTPSNIPTLTIEFGEAITDNILSSKTNAPTDDWDMIENLDDASGRSIVRQLIREATNNVLDPHF